ncbi:Glycosyl hydrolase 5 family protein [Bienertia sinuspersici]
MERKLFPTNSSISITLLLHTFLLATLHALPLSTNSRWIVDEKGQRVKLACVNWSAHLELVVAEGLSKRPVDVISKNISDMGFNCVRLTWPLYLATNSSLASLSVRQSFHNAGLLDSFSELQANNPSIVDLSLINAFKAVVASLAKNKVMVILDNHLSKPGWCCSFSDGEGFFGDEYFNPELWINGLTKMATLFKDNPIVVGMSLRNELRGPKQNAGDWYRYMQRAAKSVHEANPNVVVILSGLSFDTDLTFLKQQPVSLNFTQKLAFEVHRYSFSGGKEWETLNANEICGIMTNTLMNASGFLVDQGFPLFVGEWGLNLNSTSESDKRFLNCFLAWLVEHDLDWALWTLAGSYYVKGGIVGEIETFGLFNWDWTQVRNKPFLQRISVIQSPLQGLCILSKEAMGVQLGNCKNSNHWKYTPHNTLEIKGSYRCLKAQGLDRPARLTLHCPGEGTSWATISDSKLHLAATLSNNSTVCLDVDSQNNLITSSCKCLSKDSKCDPGSQWFKIASAYQFTAS